MQCLCTIWQSDNYFDTSEGLWDFKRYEVANNVSVTNNDNAPSFKYKANLIYDAEVNRKKRE